MRLSTVFVSSAFVLAGMSAALPGESENILARFADDFLGEVDARAYDEESELYAQRGAISTKNHKPRSATPRYGSSDYDNHLVLSRDGSGSTPPYTSHFRRSFYEPPRYELTRRREFHPPDDRYSPPTTPGISTPSPPDTPGSPPPDWRSRLRPSPPAGSAPTTPGVSTPSSSRPGSPDRGRSRSPEWYRPRDGRSQYRRSFYDLD